MRYAQIRQMDVSDGPYTRVGFYVQGCSHHCKGCYNPETWSYNGGKEWTEETNKLLINLMDKDYIKGLSILGGDPICVYERDKENLFLSLIKDVKDKYPDKTIWLWTGYLFEEIYNLNTKIFNNTELQDICLPLFQYIDVIVDGPYIEREKERLKYASSRNQRVIDVKNTIEKNKIVIYESL